MAENATSLLVEHNSSRLLDLKSSAGINMDGSYECDRVIGSGPVHIFPFKTKFPHYPDKYYVVLRPQSISFYYNPEHTLLYRQIYLDDIKATFLQDAQIMPRHRAGRQTDFNTIAPHIKKNPILAVTLFVNVRDSITFSPVEPTPSIHRHSICPFDHLCFSKLVPTTCHRQTLSLPKSQASTSGSDDNHITSVTDWAIRILVQLDTLAVKDQATFNPLRFPRNAAVVKGGSEHPLSHLFERPTGEALHVDTRSDDCTFPEEPYVRQISCKLNNTFHELKRRHKGRCRHRSSVRSSGPSSVQKSESITPSYPTSPVLSSSRPATPMADLFASRVAQTTTRIHASNPNPWYNPVTRKFQYCEPQNEPPAPLMSECCAWAAKIISADKATCQGYVWAWTTVCGLKVWARYWAVLRRGALFFLPYHKYVGTPQLVIGRGIQGILPEIDKTAKRRYRLCVVAQYASQNMELSFDTEIDFAHWLDGFHALIADQERARRLRVSEGQHGEMAVEGGENSDRDQVEAQPMSQLSVDPSLQSQSSYNSDAYRIRSNDYMVQQKSSIDDISHLDSGMEREREYDYFGKREGFCCSSGLGLDIPFLSVDIHSSD